VRYLAGLTTAPQFGAFTPFRAPARARPGQDWSVVRIVGRSSGIQGCWLDDKRQMWLRPARNRWFVWTRGPTADDVAFNVTRNVSEVAGANRCETRSWIAILDDRCLISNKIRAFCCCTVCIVVIDAEKIDQFWSTFTLS
jgi:hypothetical protein